MGGGDGPTPADAKERLVRTYARKVRSDERWSRATEPVFRKMSETLNGTVGFGVPAPAAAPAGTEVLSAFGWEEEEGGAGADVPAVPVLVQSGLGLGWPASALARDWVECVSLTSSSSSSSSSEFGRVSRGTRMGDGWGARRLELVSSEGIVEGCIQFCQWMKMKIKLGWIQVPHCSSVRSAVLGSGFECETDLISA